MNNNTSHTRDKYSHLMGPVDFPKRMDRELNNCITSLVAMAQRRLTEGTLTCEQRATIKGAVEAFFCVLNFGNCNIIPGRGASPHRVTDEFWATINPPAK